MNFNSDEFYRTMTGYIVSLIKFTWRLNWNVLFVFAQFMPIMYVWSMHYYRTGEVKLEYTYFVYGNLNEVHTLIIS